MLADNPDPSLQGTVAYFHKDSACIRVVAAQGRPDQDVLCLPPDELDLPAFGPLCAWEPEGRLQVSMYRITDGPTVGEWQRIVDVAMGAVEKVPEAELPADLPPSDWTVGPLPGPNGEQIDVILDPSRDGLVELILNDAAGARTLWSTTGGPDYRLWVLPVWSPDGRWIVVEDSLGQVLLVTTGDSPVIRVLATGAWTPGDYSCLAVTGENLLEGEG